jgi:hypothetical protein
MVVRAGSALIPWQRTGDPIIRRFHRQLAV